MTGKELKSWVHMHILLIKSVRWKRRWWPEGWIAVLLTGSRHVMYCKRNCIDAFTATWAADSGRVAVFCRTDRSRLLRPSAIIASFTFWFGEKQKQCWGRVPTWYAAVRPVAVRLLTLALSSEFPIILFSYSAIFIAASVRNKLIHSFIISAEQTYYSLYFKCPERVMYHFLEVLMSGDLVNWKLAYLFFVPQERLYIFWFFYVYAIFELGARTGQTERQTDRQADGQDA